MSLSPRATPANTMTGLHLKGSKVTHSAVCGGKDEDWTEQEVGE